MPDTITVKTPNSNQTIILKSYITGRDRRELTNVFLNGDMQFSADGKDIKGLKGNMVALAEDLALKTVVLSIDGDSSDIVNKILNMHAQDYSFVVKEVNKITSDVYGEEVKKN